MELIVVEDRIYSGINLTLVEQIGINTRGMTQEIE